MRQLSPAEAEKVELRLLTDAEFSEEYDIAVNTIVDEYLEDELSPEEREQAEIYFFKSVKRREKLQFAAALKRRKKELSRESERRKSRTPYLRAAAIAFITIGLGAVTLRTYWAGPSLNKGLEALHSAYGEERPLESRISGFKYAPVPDPRGGVEPRVDQAQLELATTIILGNDTAKAGADVQNAIGQYYLSKRKFDEAIERFRRSLALDGNDSQVQSDLGVALLERGKLRRHERETGEYNVDFADSLTHFNRALELDGNNLEALFNRALLYQEMGLTPQSENDWRQYLQKDSTSQWAEEARRKLQGLEQERGRSSSSEEPVQDFLDAHNRRDEATAWEVVRRNYSSAGNTITNALVESYLDLAGKSDSKAAESKLDALSYVGKLEQQATGDTYTSELAQFYKRSTPQQRRNLAHARAQMSKAYDLFLRSNISDALTYYSQAEQTFRENGDESEATLATYRMGHCYWLKPELKKSEEVFTHLREVTDQSKYKWLFNQSIYRTASIRVTYNDYSESIDYARQALKQSEQMGDFVGTLNALIMLADQYRTLNDQKKSWSYLHRAWKMTDDKATEPLQRWGVFTGTALNLSAAGLHEAALEYQKEALRLSFELKPERPLIISRSYVYLALAYGQLKNYDAGQTNINLAFEIGRRLENEDSGREIMANALLFAGDLFRDAGQYDNALKSYDRSIDLYQQLKYPYFTYPAHRGRLQVYLAKGDDAATKAEIDRVLAIFDQYRSSLKRESQRNTFFSVEQSVYDLAADFAWTRQRNPELALEYCELSRARSLLDARQKNLVDEPIDEDIEKRLSATGKPLPVSELKEKAPHDTQIVQYAVLDEKLLIWVINGNQITPHEQTITSEVLGKRVRRFVASVGTLPNTPDETFKSDAKELHTVLISPIESLLDEKKLICIVPDKVLHYLPFGALFSEADNRYVVEKFRIQLAPSSSLFLEPVNKVNAGDEQVLSVGNPKFDPRSFPTLQPLPAASSEAREIADLYKSSYSPLLDRSATERAVRSGINKAHVAHFALHYVVDEWHSLYSKMVLTPPVKAVDESDDGLLQIHEIYKMNLEHMHLVVLSACQTAIEHQYGGEGAVSVARPFIAAGVPLVVATLWPVDSSSSARLMTDFHRIRTKETLTTAEALQQAQRDMLNGDDKRLRHPYYWAAFTLIGRYAKI